MEKTFAIIKPDAYKAGYAGKIIDAVNEAGLKIAALKLVHMTKEQAGGFYAVHKDKPFFKDVCEFMSSGPCFVMILTGDNAIKRWRELMGATNPEQADEGTLRKRFGANIQNNATHGSDAPETAAFEMGYFFNAFEIVG